MAAIYSRPFNCNFYLIHVIPKRGLCARNLFSFGMKQASLVPSPTGTLGGICPCASTIWSQRERLSKPCFAESL